MNAWIEVQARQNGLMVDLWDAGLKAALKVG
jgi:hypothetical protein